MNSDNAISFCHLLEVGVFGRRYGSRYGMWVGSRGVRG
jgi:hypothetical protein